MKTASEWIRQGEYQPALKRLIQLAVSSDDPADLQRVVKQLDRIPAAQRESLMKSEELVSKKFAMLSGYTLEPIGSLIRARALGKRINLDVFASEYGSFEADIHGRSSALAEFAPDLLYFNVGLEHLGTQDLAAETERWLGLWESTHRFLGCPIIQNTFEEPLHPVFGNFEHKHSPSLSHFVRALNLELARRAPAFVHFNDVDRLAAYHGRKHWRDERLYDLSKIPVAYAHLVHYADSVVSILAAVCGRAKKCLVLDLDNTLWSGVIGDDGLTGIDVTEGSPVGEAFIRFQRYIKQLKDRGVILAVCSKNDLENAREPFVRRTQGMVLGLEDISCFVANWEPKHQNIERIAQTLNIGLDAIVFADDNPAEREIVRQHLPQVTVIEMPEDPADYTHALSRSGLFETVALTAEDLSRTQQYQGNAERERMQAESGGDYSKFLVGLRMGAVCEPFGPPHFARITQLIGKTNQFNVTTRRYTESEVVAAALDASVVTRYVRLRDKFGDNGLISVLVVRLENQAAVIDTWLMSCRVLKRMAEQFLFRELVQDLLARENVKTIRGIYIPTAKNKMVEGLYAELGFARESVSPDGTTYWRFDLSDSSAVKQVLGADRVIERLSEVDYQNWK